MTSSNPSNTAAFLPIKRGKSALAVWGVILTVCVAVLVGTYMIFVEAPPPRKIVIATGGQNGAYYAVAKKYAALVQKEGLTLEVRETAGSVENLKLLADKTSGVSIAIVQSGVAQPEELTEFLALGSLYREPLWVFYRGDKTLERLSQLAGKRIGVGPQGSGTYAIAMQMLNANGLFLHDATPKDKTILVEEQVANEAKSLAGGALDAAFFVAGFDAEYIQDLLHRPGIRLLSFEQQEAYRRRFRYLAPVTIPAGMVSLGQNVPKEEVDLIAPTAMLVVRKDFHPALIPLLLGTAAQVHGSGDLLNNPGEFPSESYCDFPVDDDAKHYYKSGPPVLQRLLPFWLASLVDRAKVMLIPLIMLMMPLLRAAPPLMRWRIRRKIYLWYSDLRKIDQKLVEGITGPEIDKELAHLKDIEHHVAFVEVPLSYMEEFYHLRLHLAMLQQHLHELKARPQAQDVVAMPKI